MADTSFLGNKDYYTFDTSGRITGVFNVPHEFVAGNLDLDLVEGKADPAHQYVIGHALSDRPRQATELRGKVLSNLPVPCLVVITGASGISGHQCAESSAELEFDQPGFYTIRVEAWPYLDAEFTIENPA